MMTRAQIDGAQCAEASQVLKRLPGTPRLDPNITVDP